MHRCTYTGTQEIAVSAAHVTYQISSFVGVRAKIQCTLIVSIVKTIISRASF